MAEPRNLANAAIIIACMYFLIIVNVMGWIKVGIIILILISLITWGHHYYPGEQKRLTEALIKSEEARVHNFNAGTAQLIVQTKLLQKGLMH